MESASLREGCQARYPRRGQDYIKIRYAGSDMLFVPVPKLDLVTKYIGGKGGQRGPSSTSSTPPSGQKTRSKGKKRGQGYGG